MLLILPDIGAADVEVAYAALISRGRGPAVVEVVGAAFLT